MHVVSRFAVCLLVGAGLFLGPVELRGQSQTPTQTQAGSAPQTTTPPTQPTPRPQTIRKVILLDPGHGGTDPGADLGNNVAERDVTFSIATKLRTALAAQGFTVLLTRDSAATDAITAEQRAQIANHSRALACISLHATRSGSGIHVYTSALQPAADTARYVPTRWETAQDRFVAQSTQLAAGLKSAFSGASLTADVSTATVPPLDSLTCPAVAVEFAPIDNVTTAIRRPADGAYQDAAVRALTAAMVKWRTDNTPQPVPAAPTDTEGESQ